MGSSPVPATFETGFHSIRFSARPPSRLNAETAASRTCGSASGQGLARLTCDLKILAGEYNESENLASGRTDDPVA